MKVIIVNRLSNSIDWAASLVVIVTSHSSVTRGALLMHSIGILRECVVAYVVNIHGLRR